MRHQQLQRRGGPVFGETCHVNNFHMVGQFAPFLVLIVVYFNELDDYKFSGLLKVVSENIIGSNQISPLSALAISGIFLRMWVIRVYSANAQKWRKSAIGNNAGLRDN